MRCKFIVHSFIHLSVHRSSLYTRAGSALVTRTYEVPTSCSLPSRGQRQAGPQHPGGSRRELESIEQGYGRCGSGDRTVSGCREGPLEEVALNRKSHIKKDRDPRGPGGSIF